VHPEFTLFSIIIRYVFFFISYKLISTHMISLEQNMILYLPIFTVMFNDPFYAATIMVPHGFT